MRPSSDSIAQRVPDMDVVTVNSTARRSRYLLGCAAVVWALNACASAPPPRTETVRRMSPSEEAEAIEAAKRHPIALTYDRPRATESLAVPPVAIPAEPTALPPPPPAAPAPAQATATPHEAPVPVEPPPASPPPPPARDEVVVVGQDPPSTIRTYTWPEADAGDRYEWVDGAWVERPRVRAYVEPYPYRWGWSGWYHPRPWVAPPVVVVPSRPHWHHHHYPAHRPRYVAPPSTPRSWNHRAPRRDVHVTPPARDRAPAVRSSAPAFRAPPARSSAPRGDVRSAPPSTSRRAVRVR